MVKRVICFVFLKHNSNLAQKANSFPLNFNETVFPPAPLILEVTNMLLCTHSRSVYFNGKSEICN